MSTRTIRTIAALTSSICFAAAAVPSISQADTATSSAKTKTSSPTVSPIIITKQVDQASP